MKAVFIFFAVVLCFALPVQAQNWAPTGARWYYTYAEDLFNGLYGYVKIEAIGEASIGGKTARELSVTIYHTDESVESMPNVYCYENEGKVYIRVQDRWELMYDFVSAVGNTHEVFGSIDGNECGSAATGSVTIEQRGDTLINGATFAWYTSQAAEGSIWHYPMKTLEVLGNLNYMFSVPVFCGITDTWRFGSLRAYIAPDETVYKVLQIPYDTLIRPEPSVWFPEGAVWYYTPPYCECSEKPCVRFQISGDTMISDVLCKRLIISNCNGSKILSGMGGLSRNDSIMFHDPLCERFLVLYDFNAQVNDTVVVYPSKFKALPGFMYNEDSVAGFSYIVTSVGQTVISGQMLKQQTVVPLKGGDWGFGTDGAGKIVERTGAQSYFFGLFGIFPLDVCPPLLRCYTDTGISHKSTNWTANCEFTTTVENPESSRIRIFPNPVADFLTVEISGYAPVHVAVYSLNGLKLREQLCVSEQTTIPVGDLASGSYMLICSSAGKVSNFQFVKK